MKQLELMEAYELIQRKQLEDQAYMSVPLENCLTVNPMVKPITVSHKDT